MFVLYLNKFPIGSLTFYLEVLSNRVHPDLKLCLWGTPKQKKKQLLIFNLNYLWIILQAQILHFLEIIISNSIRSCETVFSDFLYSYSNMHERSSLFLSDTFDWFLHLFWKKCFLFCFFFFFFFFFFIFIFFKKKIVKKFKKLKKY